MRTILVTGGCGFIGSHFVRWVLEAQEDRRVVNLDKLSYAGNLDNLVDIQDHPRYRFVQGDIANPDHVEKLFSEERPQAVVNFAAESHVDRSILDASPFLRTNVLGVECLVAASQRHGVERFLQISTDEVYGDGDGKEPFCEESRLTPSSPYAASKAAADLLCLAYSRTYGLPVLIVRSTNNYGPHQFPEKLIPVLITHAMEERPLPLYGDGRNIRDWLYVVDNCEAIDLVLHKGAAGEIYNIGAGNELTNLQVATTILQELRKPMELIRFVKDRPGHDRRYALDSAKVSRLDFRPRHRFSEAIRATVDWYVRNQEWWRKRRSADYWNYYARIYGDVSKGDSH